MTWAELYHDAVVVWLRPFQRVYLAAGHTLEDLAQEARLTLLAAEGVLTQLAGATAEYLQHLHSDKQDRVRDYARKMTRRQVRRNLLGRRAATPIPMTPESWDDVFEAESREASVHVQFALAEAVAAAPPNVAAYLRTLLNVREAKDVEMAEWLHEVNGPYRREAEKYLFDWFATTLAGGGK